MNTSFVCFIRVIIIVIILLRTIRAYWSKRRVVPPVLFRTNYYSIEIPHGVTAIILTYHPHHAKLQVLPNSNNNYFYICSTFVLFVSLFVSFVLHPLSDWLLFIITSSSINSWYLYSHLISFVWSQGQLLTLLFLSSSSFVFISHLTNFLS